MKECSEFTLLREKLSRFEAAIEAPVKTGKLTSWKGEVNDALDALRDQFVRHREQLHSTLLEEIASRDDGGEAASIEEFEQVDQQINEFFDVVKAHVAAFAMGKSYDATGDPNIDHQANEELELDRLELVARGNELVGWIKQQEEAITAWFAEAFANQQEKPAS